MADYEWLSVQKRKSWIEHYNLSLVVKFECSSSIRKVEMSTQGIISPSIPWVGFSFTSSSWFAEFVVGSQDFKDDHIRIKINQIQQKETVSYSVTFYRSDAKLIVEHCTDRLRRTSLRLIESSLIVLPTYNSQSFGTPKLPLCLTSSLADTRIRCEQYHESSQDSKTFRTVRFFAFLPAAFPSSTDLSMRAVNRVMEVVSQIGQRFKVDPTEIKKVRLSSPSHLLQESILTG